MKWKSESTQSWLLFIFYFFIFTKDLFLRNHTKNKVKSSQQLWSSRYLKISGGYVLKTEKDTLKKDASNKTKKEKNSTQILPHTCKLSTMWGMVWVPCDMTTALEGWLHNHTMYIWAFFLDFHWPFDLLYVFTGTRFCCHTVVSMGYQFVVENTFKSNVW